MTIDQTDPQGPWEFDGAVTDAFDDMLARSIPQYDVMRSTVADLAASHVKGGWVVDLGCSRGEALNSVISRVASPLYLGLEVSEPMLAAARDRLGGIPRVMIERHDLRDPLPLPGIAHGEPECDAILAVLTIQFTPIEHRLRILADCYAALRPGGALLVVEKVLGGSARIDRLMVEHYYRLKGAHGYTAEAIDRKRRSLEGVLVPLTAEMNVDLLRLSGFREVDCIWRWLNFAGWIAVR